jgi:chromosome segregation ATPase
MSKTLIAVFLILNIAFSANAVFLKKPSKAAFSVFTELSKLEEHEFGKKILDTIALQIKSQSPLQDIARLLDEIRQDLVTQQAESDALHNQQEQEFADTVASLDRSISDNTNTKDEAENEISILEGEIARIEAEINIKEAQLELLNRREKELDEARQRDSEEFARRQTQGVEVVGALELIIERLSTIPPNENDANLVLAELAKIGSSNPILALVQVASTFSPEALANVIGKIESLRTSLEASLEDDKREETDAIAEYQTLKSEITSTRSNISNALADLKTQLSQNENALALQERIYEEAVANIARAQEEKAVKIQQVEEQRTKYTEDKKSRGAQIEIVKQVESIIATKLDTIKDYLKDRVDHE